MSDQQDKGRYELVIGPIEPDLDGFTAEDRKEWLEEAGWRHVTIRWLEEYEIKQSNYRHPEQNTGQHTNGTPSTFVRAKDGEWLVVTEPMSLHKAKSMIEQMGLVGFVIVYCAKVQ